MKFRITIVVIAVFLVGCGGPGGDGGTVTPVTVRQSAVTSPTADAGMATVIALATTMAANTAEPTTPQGTATSLTAPTESPQLSGAADAAAFPDVPIVLELGDDLRDVAISPDGKILAVSTESSLEFWELSSNKKIRESKYGETGGIIAFSPDGQTIANRKHIERVLDGEIVLQFKNEGYGPVAFTPDGKLVARVPGESREVELLQVTDGALFKKLSGHVGEVRELRISSDGKMLATRASDNTVILWELPSGVPLQSLNPDSEVRSIGFSPDGKTIALGTYVGPSGEIQFWDTTSGTPGRVLSGHSDAVASVVYSPDGKIIASRGGSNDQSIRLWNVTDGSLLRIINSVSPGAPVFSLDGNTLAVGQYSKGGYGNGLVQLWKKTGAQGSSATGSASTPSVATVNPVPAEQSPTMAAIRPTQPSALSTTATTAPTTAFASGGLGLSRAEWEKLHGPGGEGMFETEPGRDGHNIAYIAAGSNELVGVIAKGYNPEVSINKARAEIRTLLPADAQSVTFNEEGGTYDTYLSESLRNLVPPGTTNLYPELNGPDIWNGAEPGTITIKYDGSDTNVVYVLVYIGGRNK